MNLSDNTHTHPTVARASEIIRSLLNTLITLGSCEATELDRSAVKRALMQCTGQNEVFVLQLTQIVTRTEAGGSPETFDEITPQYIAALRSWLQIVPDEDGDLVATHFPITQIADILAEYNIVTSKLLADTAIKMLVEQGVFDQGDGDSEIKIEDWMWVLAPSNILQSGDALEDAMIALHNSKTDQAIAAYDLKEAQITAINGGQITGKNDKERDAQMAASTAPERETLRKREMRVMVDTTDVERLNERMRHIRMITEVVRLGVADRAEAAFQSMKP